MQPPLRLLCAVLISATATPAPAADESVQIVDSQGRAMAGRLVTSNGTTVSFVRESDQKPFTVPLANLDAATQKTVRDWIAGGGSLAEKYDITVDTGKTRKTDAAKDDFDDKRVNLSPVITVKNPDTSFSSRDGKLTVLFLGRPVDNNSNITVFATQTFDLAKLEPLKSVTFEMAKISEAYDSRGYAKFGSRYLGYAVFVHHPGGKSFYSFSVPAALVATYGDRMIPLKTKTVYDKDLK